LASTPRRIDFSLFDDNLKTLINASAKVFPVDYIYVTDNLNPSNYEYVRVIDGEHRKEIYHWENGVFELIGADDKEVDFETDIINKPSSYPPSEHVHANDHSHENKSVLDIINQTLINTWNTVTGKADKTYVDANDHSHGNKSALDIINQTLIDTWNTVTGKADKTYVDGGLASKSDSTHNHDSAYAVKYTEGTVSNHETRLTNIESGYSAAHAHSNLSILEAITQTIVDTWNTVANKPDKTYVDTELAKKADSTTLSGHTGNTTMHVTQTDKDTWNSKTQITQGTVQPTSGFWFKEV